eukprot:TRINITY_DN27513_c0_g1_i1.p1 TRINITY_DN27513_c0_g1~~TRINITY_DN27513_c0_g1_i1.p1  ORF type:complete len:1604 (-),score=342.57 TRINITY_DN27513_c0_g1_i1:58-4869(-)
MRPVAAFLALLTCHSSARHSFALPAEPEPETCSFANCSENVALLQQRGRGHVEKEKAPDSPLAKGVEDILDVLSWNPDDIRKKLHAHSRGHHTLPVDTNGSSLLAVGAAQSCDFYKCELTATKGADVDQVLRPGTGPFASLQGVFWLDGIQGPVRVITFAGWETEYKSDGSVSLTGSVYEVNQTAWSSGLFGWGMESQAVYGVAAFMSLNGALNCKLRNGDVSECTVGYSIGGVLPLYLDAFEKTTLVRRAGSPPAFDGTTQMLSMSLFSQSFKMRQIIDGQGKKTSAWDVYARQTGNEDLLIPQLTAVPVLFPDLVQKFYVDASELVLAVLKALDVRVKEFTDFIKTDFDSLVPTFDVYEYKLNCVRPLDAMCPFRRYDSYVIGAYDVAGGGFSLTPPRDFSLMLQKILNALDGFQKIIRGFIWKYAQWQDGGSVNPATSTYLHRWGPVPFLFTWNDVSNLLLVLISLPAFVVGSGGNRVTAFMNFAKVTCFEPTVLGNGPQKFKYDEVMTLMTSPGQLRGFYTATVPSGLFIFNKDAAIMLSTSAPAHTQLRSAYKAIGLAESFEVPLESIRSAEIAEEVSEANVGKLVLPTVLEMLWGQMPPDDVLAVIEPYLTYGKLGIFGQPVYDYVLWPTGLYKQIINARVAARKWALTTPYAATVLDNSLVQSYIASFPGEINSELDYEQEYNWWTDWSVFRRRRRSQTSAYSDQERHFIQNVVDIGLFAGFVGTSDLTLKCITYQQENASLKALFEQDPETFIIELMRADSAVTSVTALLEKDEAMTLEGFNVTMAKGTPVQNVIATANLDLTHWDKPEEINPQRQNLGDSLSWNGPARYVEAQDITKAPRYCPGYCASIKAGAAICAKYMGSFDKLEAEGKIGGPVKCNNFNRDCLGEWSDWTSCSQTCEVGQRSRTFKITQPAAGSGRHCLWRDNEVQTDTCEEQLCPAQCFEKDEQGKCLELSWKMVDEKCPQSALEVGRVVISSGAVIHFYGISPPDVGIELPKDVNRLLMNSSAATWDVETFSEFTYTEFFAIVQLGLRATYFKPDAASIQIPTATAKVPAYWVGPTLVPDQDIDEGSDGSELALLATQCLALEMRDGFVWRDDLNVTMRNLWHLVMGKEKYYTSEIAKVLGHSFKRYKDYVYEKFVWYSMDGYPVYPEQWDFAKLFLRNYEAIYAAPSVVGQYHQAPAVWEDAAEQFLAFGNIASHRLEVVDSLSHAGETAVYAIKLSKYRAVPVREGFGKMGADMYFSADGLPLAVSDGETMYWKTDITEEEWQYWKFVWRSSMTTIVTARDHLLFTHMFMSNVLATASRESLSPTHPLRRYLTRFTWGSISIDSAAQGQLVGSKVITGRGFPFVNMNSVTEAIWEGLPNIYDTFAPLRNPEVLPSGSQYKLLREAPYYTNGTQLYHIIRDFFGDYIDIYKDTWCVDAKLEDEIVEFQARLDAISHKMGGEALLDIPDNITDARDFGCKALSNLHESLTGWLFGVSGWHSHVGTVAAIYLDPEFASFSWREGQAYAPPKQHLITTGLAAATGKVTPTFIEDYTHLCKGISDENACTALFKTYQTKFVKFSDSLTKEQEGNPLKYIQMNPNFVENSVAK